MNNPYLAALDNIVDQLMGQDSIYEYTRSQQKDEHENWTQYNEWIHPFTANYLVYLAFAYTVPESRWHNQEEVIEKLCPALERLAESAHDNRWYHLEQGMGNRNIDRFTALPAFEITTLLKNSLPETLVKKLYETLDGVLQTQMKEFTERGRIYPNMDIYYCLIMWHGYEVFKNEDYKIQFEKYLQQIEGAQFDEGAWTYIEGSNECPGYHTLNTVLIGWLAVKGKNKTAQKMIEKSIPYYPQVVSSSGIVEYYTDPWWKHCWEPLESYGADMVANITGDKQNKFIADMCREETLNQELFARNATGLYLYFVAATWQEVEAEQLPENTVTYDKNIEGPRGKFSNWSWAATGRYLSDTIVGAAENNFTDVESITGLLAITPEVSYREDDGEDKNNDRQSLGMPPAGSKGKTEINSDKAVFDMTYQLAALRTMWTENPFPREWQCRQKWEMDKESLHGLIEITSLADQESKLPIIKIRWGKYGKIEDKGDSTFKFRNYDFKVEAGDFVNYIIKEAKSMPVKKRIDAEEVIYSINDKLMECKKGDAYTLKISIDRKDHS